MRIEGDLLPKFVSAAFLAYAPRYLAARPDGTISDTPVRFTGLPLLQKDDWPGILGDKTKLVQGRFVQTEHEPQLAANVWGINSAAAATRQYGGRGGYVPERPGRHGDFRPFKLQNYIVWMFTYREARNAIEARLYDLINTLQGNQRAASGRGPTTPAALSTSRGGTTDERPKAVAVLLVAAVVSRKPDKDKDKGSDDDDDDSARTPPRPTSKPCICTRSWRV